MYVCMYAHAVVAFIVKACWYFSCFAALSYERRRQEQEQGKLRNTLQEIVRTRESKVI